MEEAENRTCVGEGSCGDVSKLNLFNGEGPLCGRQHLAKSVCSGLLHLGRYALPHIVTWRHHLNSPICPQPHPPQKPCPLQEKQFRRHPRTNKNNSDHIQEEPKEKADKNKINTKRRHPGEKVILTRHRTPHRALHAPQGTPQVNKNEPL